MENMPERRASGSTPPWGKAEGSAGWFGFAGQPGRGRIPAPRTPDDFTQSCNPDDLATFRVEQRGTGAVVVATGEIDLCTAPRLREALLSASRAAARVVLDLTAVTFLDSSGLAVLIDSLRSGDPEQEASPRLVGPRPTVRKVLDITRVSQMMRIHETVAEALGQAG